MRKWIFNLFGWRPEMGLSFYLADIFFRKILRQNASVGWPVHYTSTIHCPEKIKKGINVFPGDSPGNYIEANNGIIVGDFTNIGPGVGLLSSNHDFYNNNALTKGNPIVIGNNCWLGMNSIILPEVKLGPYTIVGAGAVVTKSFEDGYCVIAGNPAIIIKHLSRNHDEE